MPPRAPLAGVGVAGAASGSGWPATVTFVAGIASAKRAPMLSSALARVRAPTAASVRVTASLRSAVTAKTVTGNLSTAASASLRLPSASSARWANT